MTFKLFSAVGLLAISSSWIFGAESWKDVTAKDGLPGDSIQFLKQDDDGSIWIGTLTGLGLFKDGKFSKRIEAGEFWDILKLGPDRYVIATNDGVIELNGAKQQAQLAGHTVALLLQVNPSIVWAVAKNRRTEKNILMQGSGGVWTPVPRFEKEKVVSLKKTSDGNIWVSVEGDGVYMVNPAKDLNGGVHHLEGANVTTMLEDSKKRLWFGLWGSGVVVYDGTTFTSHLKNEKSSIFSIKEDKSGTIWVATSQKGLWHFDGKDWANEFQDEGAINLLETTSDGHVWISSQTVGGLRYWDGKKWSVVLSSPLPIRCMLETKEKKVWAGGVLDGLHILQ